MSCAMLLRFNMEQSTNLTVRYRAEICFSRQKWNIIHIKCVIFLLQTNRCYLINNPKYTIQDIVLAERLVFQSISYFGRRETTLLSIVNRCYPLLVDV